MLDRRQALEARLDELAHGFSGKVALYAYYRGGRRFPGREEGHGRLLSTIGGELAGLLLPPRPKSERLTVSMAG